MLARRLRIRIGAIPTASVKPGRMTDRRWSAAVSPNPPAGNHPVGSAIRSNSIAPTQNDGILSPNRHAIRMSWSLSRSWRRAAMTASGTASSPAITIAAPRSHAVTSSRPWINDAMVSLDL